MGEQEMEEACGSFKIQQLLGISHRVCISSVAVHTPCHHLHCLHENSG